MQINPDEPSIILKVILIGIGERAEIEMVLDTGATYTTISWGIAEQLGYNPMISTRYINLVAASTLERPPLVTLAAIEVLGVRVENVDVVCHDLPLTSGVRGLLGLSFLKHTNILIRFKDGTLELEGP